MLDFATWFNMDITVIPECMTEVHQPLDIGIFGIIKSKARCFLTQKICDDVMKKFNEKTGDFIVPLEAPRAITKRKAAVIIEFAFDDVQSKDILRAWKEAILDHLNTIKLPDNNDIIELDFRKRLNDLIIAYQTSIGRITLNQ